MTFKLVVSFGYGTALAFLSGEILVRRWLWGQVPTPVPAAVVYLLLLTNAAVLSWALRKFLQAPMVGLKRKDKS